MIRVYSDRPTVCVLVKAFTAKEYSKEFFLNSSISLFGFGQALCIRQLPKPFFDASNFKVRSLLGS